MALVHRLELMFDINVTRIEHKDGESFKGIYQHDYEIGEEIFNRHSTFLGSYNDDYDYSNDYYTEIYKFDISGDGKVSYNTKNKASNKLVTNFDLWSKPFFIFLIFNNPFL